MPVFAPTFPRRVTLSACALAAASALSACVGSPRFTDERSLTVDHRPASPLVAESANGSVIVLAQPCGSAEITATLRSDDRDRLNLARLSAERDADGTLRVSVVWPDGERRSKEGASFRITLPDAEGVRVRTSNGSVRIEGFSGAVDAVTSNAGVAVLDHDGPVLVRSSNGSVRIEAAEHAAAGRHAIDATTSNAGVTVLGAPGPLTVATSNGGVDAALSADNPGPVRLTTSNASATLRVGPAFGGILRLNTSNGRVSLDGLDGAELISSGGGQAELRVGDSGATSEVRTSNGPVRVSGTGPAGG